MFLTKKNILSSVLFTAELQKDRNDTCIVAISIKLIVA